jgi:cell division septum initiation protein DivIVA
MADEATTSASVETEDTTSTETESGAKPTLGDAGKKALDAERREKRAAEKRAADLEAKLKEFEDRDKTEAQRLGEAADAAHQRAIEAETRVMRLEVAADKGLTPAQAKRLVGNTLEELQADADDLLENFKPSSTDSQEDTARVAADLDLGSRGTTAASGDPKAEFARLLQTM